MNREKARRNGEKLKKREAVTREAGKLSERKGEREKGGRFRLAGVNIGLHR